MTAKQIQGFILAAGSSMKEVADELDVSYSLVKAVSHSTLVSGKETSRVRARICELAGKSEDELWPPAPETRQAA